MKRKEAARKQELSREQELVASSRALTQKTEELRQKVHQESARHDELANLRSAVILRARELSRKGKFKRKVSERVPKTLEWDRVTLACGHTSVMFAINTDTSSECLECVKAWMLRHAKPKSRK